MKTDYKVGDKVVVIGIPNVPSPLRYSDSIIGKILQIRQINYPNPVLWDAYFEEALPGLDFCYIRPASLLEKELLSE